MSDLQARFEAAAQTVKDLKKDPGNDAKLSLYALYKQAAEGDVQGKRPGFSDLVGRAKYDAWARVKGLTQEEAMQQYIDAAEALGN